MDLHAARHLRDAFAQEAARLATISPVAAALCRSLGPAPATAELFGRYYRIISLEEPNVRLLLRALHHAALTGSAPAAAAFFASCGGAFDPTQDDAALAEAATADLATDPEELLDYMLSQDPQPHLVERSAAMLLGAGAVVRQNGGGLWVVDAGCGGGLNLWFDRYAYQIGEACLGDSPLTIPVAVKGKLPPLPPAMPAVLGRTGLDLAPRDLSDPTERVLLESFFWPDAADQVTRFRAGARLMGDGRLLHGSAATDLAPLLFEAYGAMPAGNTLLLTQSYLWPYLSDPERQQMTWAVQRLAASLQPHKPLAWLQLEPAGVGHAELKLQTFGWADQEDRAVRRLAETDPALRWISWLE